uniref:Uncharacterized protein n=1 Tax=Geospiza parvula TaxID=87175 RepID=A0A8U8AXS8_GEOPR
MAGLELLSDAGFRADGRRPDELRKVRARLGVLARADGSAYLEQGNTKVLAAVYGPHEVRGSRAKAPPDRALLSVRCSSAPFAGGGERRRRSAQGGTDRRAGERALLLRGVLEGAVLSQLYPRSQIDVHVQVSSGGFGGVLGCLGDLGVRLGGRPGGAVLSQPIRASTARRWLGCPDGVWGCSGGVWGIWGCSGGVWGGGDLGVFWGCLGPLLRGVLEGAVSASSTRRRARPGELWGVPMGFGVFWGDLGVF